ncbi:hypothetical protein [Sphingobacterium sp. IITKGP-BTPF85]|nr:hypothetical protein [Sphingobacterium sp. IITKGP-BTPF85]KKX48351.1 hypothetical protein L950_0221605 [Sphingobacterium sp. IITKGP-BTPF85]
MIGSVEYNAQFVNESDPFNPQQDEVKEVKAVKKHIEKEIKYD